MEAAALVKAHWDRERKPHGRAEAPGAALRQVMGRGCPWASGLLLPGPADLM